MTITQEQILRIFQNLQGKTLKVNNIKYFLDLYRINQAFYLTSPENAEYQFGIIGYDRFDNVIFIRLHNIGKGTKYISAFSEKAWKAFQPLLSNKYVSLSKSPFSSFKDIQISTNITKDEFTKIVNSWIQNMGA